MRRAPRRSSSRARRTGPDPNARVVSIGDMDFYDSYTTSVAYRTPEEGLVISENVQRYIGLEHKLWEFSSDGGTTYSDMNQWGPFLRSWLWWFGGASLIGC